ncbi:hypothetical protein EVG20_g2679 [Dentipellis fragilis]|uniref:Uncharacterized protein n=1 Tax=Dentipellis fragilis TaxID=205917 RepID=A0A4Y9Z627_9AGAM|nr:hypothetical protein EVG20_g2679 [Dentipellis fragilis]
MHSPSSSQTSSDAGSDYDPQTPLDRSYSYVKFEPANRQFWEDFTDLGALSDEDTDAAYVFARELLTAAKQDLLKAGGWVEDNTVEDLFVLTRGPYTLALPTAFGALVDPVQADLWAGVFESLALFPVSEAPEVTIAKTEAALKDIPYLLQCIAPGLLLLIAVNETQGSFVTRGLPPMDWLEAKKEDLEGVLGTERYERLHEAIATGRAVDMGTLEEEAEEEWKGWLGGDLNGFLGSAKMALVIEGFWTTLASPGPYPKHSRRIGTLQRHRIATSIAEEHTLVTEEAGRTAAGERSKKRGLGTPVAGGGRVGCEKPARHRGTPPYDVSKRATRALTREQAAALLQELRGNISSLVSPRGYSSRPWTRRSPSKGCNRLPKIPEQDDVNADDAQMSEHASSVSLPPIVPASPIIKKRGGMTALESISEEENEDEVDDVKVGGDYFDGVFEEDTCFSTAKPVTTKPRRTWMTTKFTLANAKTSPMHEIRESTGCGGRTSRPGYSLDGMEDIDEDEE